MPQVFGYGWDAQVSEQVLFPSVSAGNIHIHELYRSLGGTWGHHDLTQIAAAPIPYTWLSGYAWGNTKHAIYTTQDGHVHDLQWSPSVLGGWHDIDLTAQTGAPTADSVFWNAYGSVVDGYGWAAGKSEQIVFRTTDGHVHELYLVAGKGWHHADLTFAAGAPAAGMVANGYAWEGGKSKQVVFIANGHVHELHVTVGEKWRHADLTILACAPQVPAIMANGYAWEAGQSKQVVFETGDGHIHELYSTPPGKYDDPTGVWNHADLTDITGAPLANRVINGYAWEAGQSKQVVFVTDDQHIHELYVTLGGAWKHADLTLAAGAPSVINGTLPIRFPQRVHGYAWEAAKAKHVVFLGEDNHIHELWVTPGHGWKDADLTKQTGAPPPN